MVIHYVRDMGRARAFYGGALGLADEPTPGSGSPGWHAFRCDDLIVAPHGLPAEEAAEGPLPHAGLNPRVDDLDGALAELRAAGGGVPVRVAEAADPDGNGFELRQPVAGEER